MQKIMVSVVIVFYALAVNAAESLKSTDYKHITFDDIPQTKYETVSNELKMTVNKSSSFLLKPYKSARVVSSVSFEWKSEGKFLVKDKEQEQSKKGDDSQFRLGLLIEGDAPTVPFFAPGWIKAIRDSMHKPSDKLVYLSVGTRTTAGQNWESPYSDSMEIRAVASVTGEEGWNKVNYSVPEKTKIVGIWLMADGDNTGSEFTTWLRNLVVE